MQRPLLLALALLVASPVTAAAAECPSLSGFVYHDRNDNGLRGSAENPIANVTVSLVNAAGTTIVQVTHSLENAQYGSRIVELKDGWMVGDERVASAAGAK